MEVEKLLELYRVMYTARRIDQVEQELTGRGEAFFHVAGAGHEASATLASHLTAADWLHCHYRDKALMLARGVTPRAFFDALFCKQNSHSRGRQMSAHMSDPALKLLSIVGPVGNSALQAAGVAAQVKNQPGNPIVLCSVGDGTTQQGEFLEAVAEAVRQNLPVLFLVEDNRWAISTTTEGRTFYSHPDGDPSEFYGMKIQRINGRKPLEADRKFAQITSRMRMLREPQLVVFDVERLSNHTNADDQNIYREEAEIREAAEGSDPIENLAAHLLENGCTAQQLESIRQQADRSVAMAEDASAAGPEPEPSFTALKQLPAELTHPSHETRGNKEGKQLTMREAMGAVLHERLQNDDRVTLYGQDIEDPKGDVFGVTKGLSNEFGKRVQNAPLTESTIMGVSIGRAMAGGRPVAFLQFADFLPLAYNQIVSELGSLHWRTDGGWQAPVIVMVACGGFRPGLGPFHAQTFESLMAHTPGIDVFMPSTAADATGLLNAAFKSERPSIFFYPKSCLNDPANTTSEDTAGQFTPIGPARIVRSGRDITFVGWGNTVRICKQAAEALETAGVEAEVIDLRTIAPWDQHSVIASAEKTAHMVVVHEDNHTCGVGAEIVATVSEKVRVPVAVRRVTRADTFVPCNFGNQIEVLPSFKRVLTTAAEMLDLDLKWQQPETAAQDGIAAVEAVGSGPADESVQVVELMVKPGDKVERGQLVASLEATKSVFELTSPHTGTVEELIADEGETVAVGEPLFTVKLASDRRRVKPITQEQPGTPILTRKASTERLRVPRRHDDIRAFEVGVSSIATVEGSRHITNDQLLSLQRGGDLNMTAEDIIRRTGIESRFWVSEDENAVNMAVRACWKVLDQEGLIPADLDLVICATTSPNSVTPSMACQVLSGLSDGKGGDMMVQAYDINAACSGYMYALQAGYDFLQSTPHGRVLIVTAEVLSPLLDPEDFDTAILFGDAASATILYGESHIESAGWRVHRPELSAKGDDGSALTVPRMHDGFIQMQGRKVFTEAVRSMIASLTRVCAKEGLSVNDLNMVVPHQANQRIIDAIASRIDTDVFSNIRNHGNTSSTSIPLCLDDLSPTSRKGDRFGLCAFGGGFTFGAGILEKR